MRIGISGSWKEYKREDWKLKQTKEDFARACFDIGFKLAAHGHSVIVGSQSPNTADLYIVEGIVKYVEKHDEARSLDYPLVNILRPKDELFPFKRSSERFPQVFSRYEKVEPDWDTAHVSAVEEADAVLIVGGAESSYMAGRAAIASGKTLVPVGCFGGAGRRLLDRVLGKPDLENKENYRQLYGPWTDYRLQVVLDLLGVSDTESAQSDKELIDGADVRMWDFFICHASEDKEEVARPLAQALSRRGLKVWYDEFTLKLGDSLRRSIDRGLAQSRYGVVILSPHFFAKEWPQRELDGLAALELDGEKKILPVWHKVSREDVAQYSPTLADRVAVSTEEGMDIVLYEILDAVRPDGERMVELPIRPEVIVESDTGDCPSCGKDNSIPLRREGGMQGRQIRKCLDCGTEFKYRAPKLYSDTGFCPECDSQRSTVIGKFGGMSDKEYRVCLNCGTEYEYNYPW